MTKPPLSSNDQKKVYGKLSGIIKYTSTKDAFADIQKALDKQHYTIHAKIKGKIK